MEGVKKISAITTLWGKWISRVLNINCNIVGKLPSDISGLIVSNHLSYIDILIHASIFNIRFAPKSDIENWFFVGWMVNSSKPVWVNRTSRAASLETSQEFIKTLNHGINLIVYPEGTTTCGQKGILPFKSTSFESSIASKSPIIPVLIKYTDDGADTDICWHSDMRFFPHVWSLLARKKINAEIHILDTVYPGNMTRKELSEYVHGIMESRWKAITNNYNSVLERSIT